MKFQFDSDIDHYLKAVISEYIGDRFTSIHHYYSNGKHYVKISVTVTRVNHFRINQLDNAAKKVDISLVSWDMFGGVPVLDLVFVIGVYNG